ncbi:hypothetical protein [Marininema halotolerans]|nr:hypothetical protein [Marininema halotolerans]
MRMYLPEEDSVGTYASEFGFDHLSLDKQRVIYEMIDALYEVSQGNLYIGFKNENTLEPLREMIKIMNENKINIPPIHPFKKSRITEAGGWGFAIQYKEFIDK